MSSNSLTNILEKGIYINSSLVYYKALSYYKLIRVIDFMNKFIFFSFLRRAEFQYRPNNIEMINRDQGTSRKLLQYFNVELLRMSPPYKTSSNLLGLHILRKYLIKSHAGRCHALGKPVRGQRTWSNASNAKLTNGFLRKCLVKKNLTSITVDLDEWS